MQELVVYFTHLYSLRQATTQTGNLQEKERSGVVLLFTYAALIRPWTQNGILEDVHRKSLKKKPTNFSSTRMRICVKDTMPLENTLNIW